MDNPLVFIVYQKKQNEVEESAICSAVLVRATENGLVFQTQEYLPVALGTSYFVQRQFPMGKLELWLIEFPKTADVQVPHTYDAQFVAKAKDVEEPE